MKDSKDFTGNHPNLFLNYSVEYKRKKSQKCLKDSNNFSGWHHGSHKVQKKSMVNTPKRKNDSKKNPRSHPEPSSDWDSVDLPLPITNFWLPYCVRPLKQRLREFVTRSQFSLFNIHVTRIKKRKKVLPLHSRLNSCNCIAGKIPNRIVAVIVVKKAQQYAEL